MIESAIQDIQRRLMEGRYLSEASVSQGIVQRILSELGWDITDPDIVYPQYPLKGLWVDFALCYPPRQPMIFIEIKQVGKSEGADQQLFEYAFREGIPVGVLTDGRTWHFYLPSGQGDYSERLVYKLDILEREVDVVVQRFRRYLDYDRVRKEDGLEAIQQDYREATRARRARNALPEAWNRLVEEKDVRLLELLASKVEDMGHFKPDHAIVATFLSQFHFNSSQNVKSPGQAVPRIKSIKQRRQHVVPSPISSRPIGFTFRNVEYGDKKASRVVVAIFNLFSEAFPGFEEKFYELDGKTGNRGRRYIAKTERELNPVSGVFQSHRLRSGWWIDTKYDVNGLDRIIKLACKAAGVEYGTELQVRLK